MANSNLAESLDNFPLEEKPSVKIPAPQPESVIEAARNAQSPISMNLLIGSAAAMIAWRNDPSRFSPERLEKEAIKHARKVTEKEAKQSKTNIASLAKYKEAKQEYYNKHVENFRGAIESHPSKWKSEMEQNRMLQKAFAHDDARRQSRQQGQLSQSQNRPSSGNNPLRRLNSPAGRAKNALQKRANKIAKDAVGKLLNNAKKEATKALIKGVMAFLKTPPGWITIAIFLVVALVLYIIVGWQASQSSNNAKQGILVSNLLRKTSIYKFEALGDSLTEWPNLPAGSSPTAGCASTWSCNGAGPSWPSALAAEDSSLQLIKNSGLHGDTTTQILARFKNELASPTYVTPDVLFLQGGTNDTGKGIATISNLKAIITAAQNAGIKYVILLTIPNQCKPPASFTALNIQMKALASSFSNLTVIDINNALTCGPDYQPDGLHYTDIGAKAVADYIDAQIKSLDILPTSPEGQNIACDSGDYTTCLKDQFHIIISGTLPSSGSQTIFNIVAKAAASQTYQDLLTCGSHYISIVVTTSAGASTSYSKIVLNDFFNSRKSFGSRANLLIHELGHQIYNNNCGRIQQKYSHPTLSSKDSACYDRGYLISYALRSPYIICDGAYRVDDINGVGESFAETLADYVYYKSYAGSTGYLCSVSLTNTFNSRCSNTYNWAKDNVFDGIEF
jgi:lysophospholipase L1-like esterase